ncbi:MAG: Na/Pi cotransporter family protein [Bacilli bacterium]|nr:Na/Pi cotransporter family protein [Bacilli bacterium]MBN2877547.1 Na/Pi cotransporter family protein [Bacilli bacterium]
MPFIFLDIDWKLTIFEIVGGLGIFLYGINLMSESLKKIAGSKLKMILEKTTNTPLKGIFVGIFITAIIQSSSATSALVVGLVRAGLMTLPQAVGVIFGANIGTTFTSVLISLHIGDYALPIMFVGAVLIFFIQNKKVKNYGRALMGFGMLFFGLEKMGDALKVLSTLPGYISLLQSVAAHPILGVLTGAATTSVIQSSSATIGILQTLYNNGGVPLIGAIAIVLGDNIGTTVTSVMASIGGSSQAKRAALIHVMFNTIGTVIFFILLRPYTMLIEWFAQVIGIADWETSRFTISLAHVGFNLINVFILYFFIRQMVWLVSKIIPSKGEIVADEIILEETLVKESPDLALENTRTAIGNMGNVARGMYEFVYNYAFSKDMKELEMANQCEELLDNMDDKIHNYLVKIGAQDLVDRQIQQVAKDIDTITDIERIGDHLNNLSEFFEMRHEKRLPFHEKARQELEHLFDFLRTNLDEAITAYINMDRTIALEVNAREDELDRLVKKYRKNHINRINDKTCEENEAGFYVDILSNMERIGDHCNNMAINVLTDDFTHDEQYY